VSEGVDGCDASDGESASAFGHFIVDVGGRHDRLGAATKVGFVEASLDASLAVGQFLSYAPSHLKSLVVWSGGEQSILHETPETPRDFEFFQKSLLPKAGDFAFFRTGQVRKHASREKACVVSGVASGWAKKKD
jgi:hypothetical protein